MAGERWYDFPEFGGYLGNVGLNVIWGMSVKLAPILIFGKNCTHPGTPRSRAVPGKKSRLVRGGPSLTGRRQMDETIETVGTTTPHPPPTIAATP